MKDLIKYGLIGVAGYLVYKNFGSMLGLPAIASSSLLPAGSTVQTTSPALIDLKRLIMQRAGIADSAAMDTVHVWNWYYNAVRGTEAPPFTFPAGVNTDTYRMSLDEYLKGTGLGNIQSYKHRAGYLKMAAPLGSHGRVANG